MCEINGERWFSDGASDFMSESSSFIHKTEDFKTDIWPYTIPIMIMGHGNVQSPQKGFI